MKSNEYSTQVVGKYKIRILGNVREDTNDHKVNYLLSISWVSDTETIFEASHIKRKHWTWGEENQKRMHTRIRSELSIAFSSFKSKIMKNQKVRMASIDNSLIELPSLRGHHFHLNSYAQEYLRHLETSTSDLEDCSWCDISTVFAASPPPSRIKLPHSIPSWLSVPLPSSLAHRAGWRDHRASLLLAT